MTTMIGRSAIGAAVEVRLDDLCREHGGGQEYPDGRDGRIVAMSKTQLFLALVNFRRPFVVGHGRNAQVKTCEIKIEGRVYPNTLWVPLGQLSLVGGEEETA